MCKWGGSGARKTMRETLPPEDMNGALNPDWVEALMGWPVGWTALRADTGAGATDGSEASSE
jgi:hypothetical protein